ncbi:MAG: CDP-diacylglycerol--glycerol-3-phosphate 3-phosphatidyltransferase [Bacteroidetes bacterium]|nr:CDP-diacylglycerol--glycerol-3-phosphate 3-phosphatidyltransferase [Bacteroidota bacterium]
MDRFNAAMKPELNFPNVITAARILLTPLFVWLVLSQDGVRVQVAALIFLLAAISDWYDGWYARRYNAMSAFGRFFDPLADKVLIGAAFFVFVTLGPFDLWMVLVIVGRDLVVTVLRVIADLKHQPVVTSRLAKWKTALQLIFLWYVVLVFTLKNVIWIREAITVARLDALLSPAIVMPAMLLLTLLSLVTAGQYLYENRHILRVLTNGSFARTTL